MVLVCGEALIDVVREADGTRREMPGGGPFNTARALARLGVPTAFLGRVSSDPRGRRLADCLRADGVSLELTSIGPEPTTTAAAALDGEGRAIYEFQVTGTAAANLTADLLPGYLGDEVEALHLGTLGLVMEPTGSTLAGLVRRERGKRPIMLDPNVRPGVIDDEAYRARLLGLLELSTIVKASAGDLAWLYPNLDHEAAARELLSLGVRLVLVTLGSEGATAISRRGRVRLAAPVVKVVDTIGAGDAFGAAALAWLRDHRTLDLKVALEVEQLRSLLGFACQVAALTCTRAGAEPPWHWEMPSPKDE